MRFVKTRIDEDEMLARRAPGERWKATLRDDIAGAAVFDEQWLLFEPTSYDHDEPMSTRPGATGPRYVQESRDELVRHIARWDPARVLRECESKRRLIRAVEDAMAGTENPSVDDRMAWSFLICNLATTWADHKDYREEWAV